MADLAGGGGDVLPSLAGVDRPLPDQKPYVIDYDDEKHAYKLDGQPVASVTQILDKTLPKPALTWWGFRVGMAAAIELCRMGELPWADVLAGHDEFQAMVDNDMADEFIRLGAKGQRRSLVEHLAVEHKLTTNHVKDSAAQRGTAIHEALNQFAEDRVPKLADFPEVERPYLQALSAWWVDRQVEFVRLEQMVGSRTWQYAGRFDLIYRDRHTGELVLADLKTSKDVYPDSMFRQLRGYEVAWREMGGEPIDRMEIINVRRDGTYQVVTAHCPEEAWTTCVAAFHAARAFAEAQPKGRAKSTRKRKADTEKRLTEQPRGPEA